MNTSIVSFPRIGENRELKFCLEKYFRNDIKKEEVYQLKETLLAQNWAKQIENKLSFVSIGDFSFYDQILDTSIMLNIIPKKYRDLGLDTLDTYFAMARGYQGTNGDVCALSMKKWFNTNYHYLVPEFEDDMNIQLNFEKYTTEIQKAAKLHEQQKKLVLIGPYTFLKLLHFTGKKTITDVQDQIISAYKAILAQDIAIDWIQFDEPALVLDMTVADVDFYQTIYNILLKNKKDKKILLQTYFGDIRDHYQQTIELPFDAIGLDFIEGVKNVDLVQQYGFPKDTLLFAGVVNGKNIWRNNYDKTLELIKLFPTTNIVINTSCSLLHVPYTLQNEDSMEQTTINHLAFGMEKLNEIQELQQILKSNDPKNHTLVIANRLLLSERKNSRNEFVQEAIKQLQKSDFERLPNRKERELIQQEILKLPLLPTTTIGSFPQTQEIRQGRMKYRKNEISNDEYTQFNCDKIKACIEKQEEIGLDVLVHGEFERNDMVEYFGENLDGFLFTKKGWVQSYGTRCVKPPVIWGDISRKNPITVKYSVFAQTCTKKPVKGMLTGPVTILNWSFPREDISLSECAFQIGLAIRDEVLDLEKNNILIIQIDEAALREKLPLRKEEWNSHYLDWAVDAFRLTHSTIKPETQIHTHMCYSEFSDIIKEIDYMDADVISFEASRSDLQILHALKENDFQTPVGPGVYDIHSPRVPSVDEIKKNIYKILEIFPIDKVWINPDCGLKTRGNAETFSSLENMVQATKEIRAE